jgi:hypothetical protein
MPATMSTQPRDYLTRDYLTGLPTEVLVHILSYFSISDFLELSHVHPMVHNVLKSNAAQICNLAIENDPELKSRADSLGVQATKINKWLVPKVFPIFLDHRLARRILAKKNVLKRLGVPREPEGVAPINGLLHSKQIGMTWNKTGMKIKLDEPGPQFLCFLEWQRLEYDAHPMGLTLPADWGSIHYPLLCGLWTMRFLTSHEENSLAIHGFADTLRKKWFPKELLWFYGIEAVEKDMKS